ncbi:IclR family transcriptional regulator [Streptomyces sp. NPDC002276]
MQLVVRVLSVLRSVAAAEEGMRLQDLSLALDVPLGSMHRMLAMLEEERFLSRSPTNRRYFLGPAARAFGEDATPRGSGLATPHPAIPELAEKTGGTVFLTELFGNSPVCTELVEGRHHQPLFACVGQVMPPHASAAARILLAYLDEATARRVLTARPLTAFTRSTPTNDGAVMERLSIARSRGYDTCENELDWNIWEVSAPIRTSTEQVCASVTLAVGLTGLGDDGREHLRGALLDCARRMSADLGCETVSIGRPL